METKKYEWRVYTQAEPLTVDDLEIMPEGTIFADGFAKDAPGGLNMAKTGRALCWVAVRGGVADWCIYCHWAENGVGYARRHGDKVHFESHIKQLVPCTPEAFARYRR